MFFFLIEIIISIQEPSKQLGEMNLKKMAAFGPQAHHASIEFLQQTIRFTSDITQKHVSNSFILDLLAFSSKARRLKL